jgi:hypothetical protein
MACSAPEGTTTTMSSGAMARAKYLFSRERVVARQLPRRQAEGFREPRESHGKKQKTNDGKIYPPFVPTGTNSVRVRWRYRRAAYAQPRTEVGPESRESGHFALDRVGAINLRFFAGAPRATHHGQVLDFE